MKTLFLFSFKKKRDEDQPLREKSPVKVWRLSECKYLKNIDTNKWQAATHTHSSFLLYLCMYKVDVYVCLNRFFSFRSVPESGRCCLNKGGPTCRKLIINPIVFIFIGYLVRICLCIQNNGICLLYIRVAKADGLKIKMVSLGLFDIVHQYKNRFRITNRIWHWWGLGFYYNENTWNIWEDMPDLLLCVNNCTTSYTYVISRFAFIK